MNTTSSKTMRRLFAVSACAAVSTAAVVSTAAAVADAAAAASAAAAAAAPANTRQPPNIVFIFSDDHAWQAMSCYGDERHLINTPNLDSIARNGMRFDRCLVTNSLCGPSRATVLTGVYSHVNGFYDNTVSRFDGSQITFPKLLQAAGYQTAMIGKWHLVTDPTGFDFWQILIDQGRYYDPPMIRNGKRIATEGYVSDVVTDASIEWLKNRDKTRPFLLMSQHKSAHRPWEANISDFNFDNGATYQEPPTLFDDYATRGPGERATKITIANDIDANDMKLATPRDIPQRLRAQWEAHYNPLNKAGDGSALEGRALTSWKYQRFMHEYLGSVYGLDKSVGRLLDYLKREGLLENTIIIYASDQGFFLGEHGWFDKRWFYEEALRTPFVMSWPGVIKPGSVNKDMVSNLDFAPTLLEAAGVPVPARMQGRSLLPLLKGERPPAPWRTSFYYQFHEDLYGVPPHYGVVTDRYKLMHILSPKYDYWEMFDLQTDPRELKNIYDDPASAGQRATLAAELARLRAELRVPDKPYVMPARPAAKKSKNANAKKDTAINAEQ